MASSAGHNTQPIAPKSIIIPTENHASGAARWEHAASGALLMSGAALCFYNGSAWNVIIGNNTGDA